MWIGKFIIRNWQRQNIMKKYIKRNYVQKMKRERLQRKKDVQKRKKDGQKKKKDELKKKDVVQQRKIVVLMLLLRL